MFAKRKTFDFINSDTDLFKGHLKSGNELEFLRYHFKNNKIVFLVDGLDQIEGDGTECQKVFKNLKSVVDDKLIVASRPYAVIDYEYDQNINFLRLKPFSETEMKKYFGGEYDSAKKMCKSCPEMLVFQC